MILPNRQFRRAGRAAAFGMAGALALGLMPGVAGAVARDTDDACPVGLNFDDGFTDTAGSFAELKIDCIVAYGLSTGMGDGSIFSPLANVSRGQMATFIVRTLDLTDSGPPLTTPDAFDDDDGSVHEDNIDIVAALGIAQGDSAGNFRPGAKVTRGQMATFLVGQMEAAGATIPTRAPDGFDDDEGDVHEGNINIVNALGLAQGDTAGDYNPTDGVRREQMALFLARELDYLVEEGLFDPIVASGSGQIVDFNTADNFYVFVDSDSDAVVRVDYDQLELFEVGRGFGSCCVPMATFESTLSNGDQIAFDATDRPARHSLTDVTVISGTVGTVNVSADTFRVINKVNGRDVSGDINYSGGTYFTIGGSASDLAEFDDNLSEGDIIRHWASRNGTGRFFTLNNVYVSGQATDVQVSGGATLFKIDGVLGDEPAVGLPTDEGDYIASSTASPGAELFTIGGLPSTYAAFEAALTDGDTVTYSREDDVETFALTP